MSNKVKDISIKNYTYYIFGDITNVKNFDPNNIKINEKSYSYLKHSVCNDLRFEICKN